MRCSKFIRTIGTRLLRRDKALSTTAASQHGLHALRLGDGRYYSTATACLAHAVRWRLGSFSASLDCAKRVRAWHSPSYTDPTVCSITISRHGHD